METQLPLKLSELLKIKLEERCQRNPNYSLRAFARDLGVPAPRVSRWLKGIEGASDASAKKLARKLNLSKEESLAFIATVNAQFSRSKKNKQIAQIKLESILHSYKPLNVEAFKVISDWYNLAVLSLLETSDFVPKISWISKKLKISIYEAKGALDRLLSLEMIQTNIQKGFISTGVFFANPGGVPSQSVRSFHRQILTKASDALDTQTVDERDFSTLILAVDPDEITEAKEMIKDFRNEFEKRFCNSKTNKKEVCALGVQFFKLTQDQKESGEVYESVYKYFSIRDRNVCVRSFGSSE